MHEKNNRKTKNWKRKRAGKVQRSKISKGYLLLRQFQELQIWRAGWQMTWCHRVRPNSVPSHRRWSQSGSHHLIPPHPHHRIPPGLRAQPSPVLPLHLWELIVWEHYHLDGKLHQKGVLLHKKALWTIRITLSNLKNICTKGCGLTFLYSASPSESLCCFYHCLRTKTERLKRLISIFFPTLQLHLNNYIPNVNITMKARKKNFTFSLSCVLW